MISFDKKELMDACEIVSKVMSAGTSKDNIYNSILFEINKSKCTLIMMNNGNQIETELLVDSMQQEEFKFLVPFMLFNSTVKLLPNDVINIDHTVGENKRHNVQISTEGGKQYNIGCEDPELFIKMSKPDMSTGYAVEWSHLFDAISASAPAVQEGEIVSALSGLGLYQREEELCVVGARTPFFIRNRIVFEGDDFKPIIITKGLARILIGTIFDGETLLFVDANKLMILCGEVTITALLIDLNFPDVESVFAKQYDDYITVNKAEFVGCMQRIALYSDHETSRAQFSIDDCDITVTANSTDNDAKEEFGITGGSKVYTIMISLNVQNIINTLIHMDGKGDIRIYMCDDPEKAIYITADVEKEKQKQTWLLATYRD